MKKLTKYLMLAISISGKSNPRICHTTKSGRLLFYHYSLNKNSKWFLQIYLFMVHLRGVLLLAQMIFCAKKSKIGKWKLDDNNICKCITKSSQIRKAVFTEHDFNRLYNADKPVHCLDVKITRTKKYENT